MNTSGGREALIRSKLEGPVFIGGYDVSGKKHWHLEASADALGYISDCCRTPIFYGAHAVAITPVAIFRRSAAGAL
jgi:hypothetical protein